MTAAIYLAFGATAMAQDAPATPPAEGERAAATLDTITVTAQKRVENLQEVPISIQVLGTEQLKNLNVTDFDDYVKYLPSVSYQSAARAAIAAWWRTTPDSHGRSCRRSPARQTAP